jgi:hypothetical protein
METKPKLEEFAAVPGLLKLTYIVIAAGAFAYFLIYMHAAVDHPDRAVLVPALNAAAQASAGLMYAIAAMIVVFGVLVVALSFGKSQD